MYKSQVLLLYTYVDVLYPLPRKGCLAKECCLAALGGCSVHTAAGASPLGARLPRRAAAPRRELSGKLRVDRQPATSPPPRATTHVRDKLMVHDKKVGPVRKNQGCGSVRGPSWGWPAASSSVQASWS